MLIKAVSASDLHAAYSEARCPICTLNDRDERRYIDATLYDQVTNVHWREQIRSARGFCAAHTTRILNEGRSALGVALIADDLLKTLRELLAARPQERPGAWGRLLGAIGGSRALAGHLRGKAPCPLCAHLIQQTPVHVRSLLQDLATGDGQAAYAASAGLCMPHLVQALEAGDPAEGIPFLAAHQQQAWQNLEAELQEFIRKSDYQFTGEPIGAERDAWRRAFRLLAGWQFGQHLRGQ
jgi:hypothetical protein